MIPNKKEILAQLVLLWRIRDEVEPVEKLTMGALAGELMYPPIFIINALECGKEMGVLVHDYESDEVKVLGYDGVDFGEMGSEIAVLKEAFLEKLRYEAGREEDVSLGLLQSWCVGVRPSAAELALRVLVDSKELATYRLSDPDDESSTYDFYTLWENREKMWGRKQFKRKGGDDEDVDKAD